MENGVLEIMVKVLNMYKGAVVKLFLPPKIPLFPPLSSIHSNTVPLKRLYAVKKLLLELLHMKRSWTVLASYLGLVYL